LVALVTQTVKLMEAYAVERGVKLELQPVNLQPSTFNLQLSADGKALQQALINLIDNALKHSPQGETVTVGLEVRSGASAECGAEGVRSAECGVQNETEHAPRLTIWVQDRGEGIPPAEHEKIFERFYRRGSELRRETQGVGIGLSIVKHVVEAHGGRVLVRSGVGQGSRFTIELPVGTRETKPEDRNPKPE
jgi:signal transduction histidine kinase